MVHNCNICGHGEAFHDRWGICGIGGCGPCYINLDCPRCKHSFFDHSIFIDRSRVMCTTRDCSLLVCYDINHPEKPTRMSSTERGPNNVVALEPRRIQQTYEEALHHPLSPQFVPSVIPAASVAALPVVDSDPVLAPGVWKQHRPGRTYDTNKGGFVEIDFNETNERGAFKHYMPGRVWEPRVGGYVEEIPPGPPVRGYLD